VFFGGPTFDGRGMEGNSVNSKCSSKLNNSIDMLLNDSHICYYAENAPAVYVMGALDTSTNDGIIMRRDTDTPIVLDNYINSQNFNTQSGGGRFGMLSRDNGASVDNYVDSTMYVVGAASTSLINVEIGLGGYITQLGGGTVSAMGTFYQYNSIGKSFTDAEGLLYADIVLDLQQKLHRV